ncbi:MAG TPA: TonB family protein [Steroidobacteraceae bacterium]|nr:TonB family protein [Steroidobacteraceae bacterium]
MAGPASSAPRSFETGSAASGSNPAHSPTSAKAAAEVIAVTSRDDFLLELGEALGGQVAVRPVDSFEAALESISGSRRPQLLAVDARDIPELRVGIDRVHADAPGTPIVVFAASDSEKTVAGALKGSNTFAVLSIPVDRRKTAAVLEGALGEAANQRSSARGASAERGADLRAPLAPQTAPIEFSAPAEPPQAKGPNFVLIGGIAAVVLLGGAGAWWFFGRSGTAPAPVAAHSNTSTVPAEAPAVPSAVEVPVVKGTVDDLLEKARLAMRERRYTEPPNDSALLYYRSVLSADAANGEAHDGMTRLAGLLASRFDESLNGGRYEEAASALAGLKVATPSDPKVTALEGRLLQAEITKALADANIDRVNALIRQAQQSNALPADQLTKWRTEVARRQDEAKAKRLADVIDERIRDGRLLDPENDNAKFYVAQLKEQPGSAALVQRTTRDLIAAYLKKAREASLANHASDADRWVAEARAAGLSAADLQSFQRDLASSRQRAAAAESERLGQLVRDRARSGQLTDPAQDSAVFYMTQLKDGYGDSAQAGTAARELVNRLMDRATASARAGQSPESDLAQAKRWGADAAQIAAVEQIAAGKSSASAQSRNASTGLPAGIKLKRIRYVEPEYPQRAYDTKVSGVVTVQFTVDVKGYPRDVQVVSSNPPVLFDKSATDAVSRWRFEPVMVNNVATEVPTRMVIRFESPK